MNHNTIVSLIAMECERIRNAQRANDANTSFNVADARARILYFEQHLLPHGSGIDSGCNTDISKSGAERVVVKVPYHAMDDHGSYCGWFYYNVTARMTFYGLSVSVTGGRKQDREYIRETLEHAMTYVPTSEEIAPASKAVYAAE